ncbi:GH3 family domain-containing protein [Portibacter lacus]|uniref:GH3 auxin-responsive promoter n=1 Tax=Portibacter lacus TaxID=1099794 RepID=A0AA37SNR0_9BACT|nr:GH3 auxin-responsive promoter family protein [Portibacter lacus]GLR17020.1 hypothetical protein GCM10007940_16350 [Portibacter lacus]
MSIPGKIVNRKIGLVNSKNVNEQNPVQFQKATLLKLLNTAKKTEIGKYYHFDKITSFDEFQNAVPIHDYNKMYDEWWHKSLAGEQNIAWPGTVPFFALSSGTSGAPSKYIPVTKDMQKAMRQSSLGILASVNKFKMPISKLVKQWLMIGGSASLTKYNNSLVGDLSGINGRKPPLWIRRFKKPELATTMLPTWEERAEMIVKNAEKWNISVVSGIPSWVQLILEKIVDHYQIENIRELWPDLSLFVTGGINLEPYKENLENIIGGSMMYIDTYLASEGFFAFQNCPERDDMSLLFNAGIFYEFIPFNDDNFDEVGMVKEGTKAYTIDEVEEDIDYAMVISTCAGAWRYLIGDNVKFTDKTLGKIKITGRTQHFLSVCGEHLSVENMNDAVCNVKEKLDLDLREFSVGVIPKNNHFAHEWFIGSDATIDNEMVARNLDKELKRLNDDYQAERGAMLQPPIVHIIPNDWFYEWTKLRGKMNGQSKVSRVVKGSNQAEWQKFVESKRTALLI